MADFSLRTWKTRDILVLVVISLALVIITFAFSWVRTALVAALGVFGHRIASPLIILIVFTGAYIVRRPLAAIVSGLMMGLIASPFLGLATIIGYLYGGVIAEVLLATGRYRNYSLPFMLIIGVIYNVIGVGLIWVPLQVGLLEPLAIAGVFAISIVAGLVGGWLTKWIGDSIMESGVMPILSEQ
ncbi:MAG: ECF transporter S component [Chloroflexota bacterium]